MVNVTSTCIGLRTRRCRARANAVWAFAASAAGSELMLRDVTRAVSEASSRADTLLASAATASSRVSARAATAIITSRNPRATARIITNV